MAMRDGITTVTERLLPNPKDPPERRSTKLTVLLVVAMVVLMGLVGFATFWLSLRGAEQVLVPELGRKDLVTALLALQEKELSPRIQLRYSADYEKNTVIDQKPAAGSVVKAGRRVTLVVSQGPVIDTVENYVGQKVSDVRNHLQTLFASYRALLKIKEPVSYVFDSAPAGTILAQKPEPGATISGVTELELVVSRGPKGELIAVGNYEKLPFQDAIAELAAANFPFVFTIRAARADEQKGAIVSQSPAPESEVPYGTVLQLEMTRPDRVPRGQVFGMFEYVLPEYPIMVDVSLDAVSKTASTTLLSMKSPGGPISIPYIVDQDAELVLYIFDKEEIRQHAGVP